MRRLLALSCVLTAAAVALPRPAGALVPVPIAPVLTIPENSVTGHAVPDLGATALPALNGALVAAAGTPTGLGYWVAAADGGVFSFGDAPFLGAPAVVRLNQPIVGIAATPSGRGYWVVAADGGVFPFGDARFFGSLAGTRLNQPIVGIAATPTGLGYVLAAADGGVFTFGDAAFLGTPVSPNQPIVAVAASPHGYWLAGADGGMFTFGDAGFFGSLAATRLNQPIVALAISPSRLGYVLAASDGGVFTFGDAVFSGSDAAAQPAAPVVAIARTTGGYWLVHGQRFSPASFRDSGTNVARVQDRLRQLGYWLGSESGRYGTLTTQAVFAFQKVNGLRRTGTVDTVTASRLATAARPRAGAAAPGDYIEIDKSRQVLFVVRGGTVVWAFNTSTGSGAVYLSRGRRSVARTPEGHFALQREVNGFDRSPLGVLYRPKYFTAAGHAIHGYISVPPFPASHGCVRVTNAAMDFLWASALAPIGLTVWVHG